jgi:adenine deaminase
MTTFTITGNIIDIKSRNIYWGEIVVTEGIITNIKDISEERKEQPYLLPGFIDSHVHIESSMLVPSEFARLAVVHGTVGTISDPHEIANVCGLEGVTYMIENGKTVPFKFNFGAPSCVPATIFETAGAAINSEGVEKLLQMDEIRYLSEMMNFPGVLFEDEEVMKKIALAKKYNKPVDGHAPGLRGSDAKKYIDAGISTDHECFNAEEALDKLSLGMKILIREGSAAKNFEALIDLMHEHFENMMFCSDDKHPDSLADGHINQLCARAVAKGIDVFKVLQAACINPVEHYKMNVGIMQMGDPADFILIKNLTHFEVLKTYINGQLVAENGKSFINPNKAVVINQFNCNEKQIAAFKFLYNGENKIPIIEALEGQLITNKIFVTPKINNDEVVADVENDILKIVVVNRYHEAPIAKSFIKNIGIKKGALASSVAHDSHNIVAVGVDDESLCKAVNAVIRCGGGVSAVNETEEKILALPVAGLMSTENGYEVAKAYTEIDAFVKTNLGSHLNAPFMTLSFMALLVIPHLKLSDKGLFDGDNFKIMI